MQQLNLEASKNSTTALLFNNYVLLHFTNQYLVFVVCKTVVCKNQVLIQQKQLYISSISYWAQRHRK